MSVVGHGGFSPCTFPAQKGHPGGDETVGEGRGRRRRSGSDITTGSRPIFTAAGRRRLEAMNALIKAGWNSKRGMMTGKRHQHHRAKADSSSL